MIRDFCFSNINGKKILVDFENHPDIFKDIDSVTYNSFHDGSRVGLFWVYKDKEITLFDENTSIRGFPTVDKKYIVAIYSGLNGEFKSPYNAVIYNADGRVHKILYIPPFVSEKLCKRLLYLKQDNPPLSLVNYEGGLFFGGFGWIKNSKGKIVNFISIVMEKESFEQRELDPQTGLFGKCLGSGLAMYAKY